MDLNRFINYYFNKELSELSLPQVAPLECHKHQISYDPYANADQRECRDLVLHSIVKNGKLQRTQISGSYPALLKA